MCIIESVVFVFFFFLAEDGIRVLGRSRWLGDVYNGQPRVHVDSCGICCRGAGAAESGLRDDSYTHLTVPTIYCV